MGEASLNFFTVMVTTQEGPPVRPDGLADPLYSRQVGSTFDI